GHRLAIQVLEVVVERRGDTVAQGLGLVGGRLGQGWVALTRSRLIVHRLGGGVGRWLAHAAWSSSGKWSSRWLRASSCCPAQSSWLKDRRQSADTRLDRYQPTCLRAMRAPGTSPWKSCRAATCSRMIAARWAAVGSGSSRPCSRYSAIRPG